MQCNSKQTNLASQLCQKKSTPSAKILNFAQIMAPDDLWPSGKVINVYILEKPSSHTTVVPSFKFLCLTVSEKSVTLTFLGVFPNNYCPLWPLTFARGNQTMQALTAYYHQAKFQDSVINSLWEKPNVNVLVHAHADTDADAGRIPMQCIST